MWAVESGAQLEAGAPAVSNWDDFITSTPAGYETYRVTVLPSGAAAYVQVDSVLVHALLDRSLLPLGARAPQDLQSATHLGILELLLLSVLRNLNAHLAFPFQFSLSHERPSALQRSSARGASVLLSFKLTDVSAGGRVFVPHELFLRMMETSTVRRMPRLPAGVTWQFPVTVGNVTLTVDDVRHLERDDVVILEATPEMVFPKDFSRGWRLVLDRGNLSTATVKEYFERKLTMGSLNPVARRPPARASTSEDYPFSCTSSSPKKSSRWLK